MSRRVGRLERMFKEGECMKSRYVLITGATGIMGSWVLGEALERGYEPIVLMRDGTVSRARERLAAVLELYGRADLLDRVSVVLGDTREPDMGLDSREVAGLRQKLGAMVHCAASTSFNPRRDAELWATNVGGVANVLRFVAGSGIHLYHVSTAFVAGKRRGRVLETELDLNQDFHNTYERSKCESERLVQEAVARGSVQAAIFRPGVIVGATSHGQITQFLNFYGFLRFVDLASSGGFNGLRRLRVIASPDTTKNLVPVDWIGRALWHIVETDGPSGRTYHLTNPNPVDQTELQAWANRYLEPNGVRLDFTDRLESDAHPFEQAANASFRLYRPYLMQEPVFDRTNTDRALDGALPFPAIGPAFYARLLHFARQQEWEGVFGCKLRAGKIAKNGSSSENGPEGGAVLAQDKAASSLDAD